MIEYFYLTHGTVTGTAIPGQSEPESNGNEEVSSYIPKP